jgi:hypothetical protein
MSDNSSFISVIEEVEVLVAEMKELAAAGPQLRIIHRFHEEGSVCLPGEEIVHACVLYRARTFHWFSEPNAAHSLHARAREIRIYRGFGGVLLRGKSVYHSQNRRGLTRLASAVQLPWQVSPGYRRQQSVLCGPSCCT